MSESVTLSEEDPARILSDSLAALYAHDIAPLVNRLASACLLIAPNGELVRGRNAVCSMLERLPSRPFLRLEEQSFTTEGVIEQESEAIVIVAGSYRLYTVSNEQLIFSAARRATACFQRNNEDKWQIFHLHISDAGDGQIDNDLFPFAVNRETYDYVRRNLYTGRRLGILPSRIVIEDGKLHYFNPEDILYVKARGKYCTVECVQYSVPLNRLLGDMENMLGGTFIRVHRSYLVNAAHIVSVKRYELTLTNGDVVPIPKQRYAQVRREIALRIAE